MEVVSHAGVGRRQNRGFVLGSLSFGHGVSHMFDRGFPILMPAIAATLGLGTVSTASIFAVKQAGSSLTSLGDGPVVDMLKRQWGLILTWCMLLHAITSVIIGAAPTFAVVIIVGLFISD